MTGISFDLGAPKDNDNVFRSWRCRLSRCRRYRSGNSITERVLRLHHLLHVPHSDSWIFWHLFRYTALNLGFWTRYHYLCILITLIFSILCVHIRNKLEIYLMYMTWLSSQIYWIIILNIMIDWIKFHWSFNAMPHPNHQS